MLRYQKKELETIDIREDTTDLCAIPVRDVIHSANTRSDLATIL